jgi:hypothetical protein
MFINRRRQSAARGGGNLAPPQLRRGLNYYAVLQYSQYSHIKVTGRCRTDKPAESGYIKVQLLLRQKAAGVFPRIHPVEKTPALKNADIHMLRKALDITPNWFYIIVVRSVPAKPRTG